MEVDETVVYIAAGFSVVMQRSCPQKPALIRTTFLSLCYLRANEITDIFSYVTNQNTGDCNRHGFPAFSSAAIIKP